MRKDAPVSAMAGGGCSTLEPYALRVLGDSMAPEFPEGCVVIVDPGAAPRDGAYVIVEYAGDVFFRQIVFEGERRFLQALNPAHGRFELIPPYTLRGAVVQKAGRRRRDRKHYA